jgi:3-oxoacyl-[acyl-carrier protein] reductase
MPGDRLVGKVAIVSGGGSGFGAGIVKKFVHEGCRVLIWDISPEPARTLSSTLPSNKTSVFTGDVSNPTHWVSALEKCLQDFGKLDILVNNAGVVHVSKPSEEVEEEEVDRMWKVNFKPLYHSAKVVVPYFREIGGGCVVNLSSISAPRPRPRLVWYAASKGAVTAVSNSFGETRGIRNESGRGIRCASGVLICN